MRVISIIFLTNYFGPITKTALQSYQRANNIVPTGVFGFESRALLNNDPVSSSGKRLRLEKELFEGAKDQVVLQVEFKLEALGYFYGEADEVFDSVTREAIRRFQNSSGLLPTGHVSYDTWNKLNDLYKVAPKPEVVQTEATVSSLHTFTKPLSIGSRGDEVVKLQCFLQNLGFFSQNVVCTGYFGPITHKAVAEFQASKGIESIGIVGPKTRAALNAL